MAFVVDRTKQAAKDFDTGISIVPIYRYSGSTATYPYAYRRDNIEFEFEVAEVLKEKITVDKNGHEHKRPAPLIIYIIERGLRSSIDRAYKKAGLLLPDDSVYAGIRKDLAEAISVLLSPDLAVEFIQSAADMGITDNPRSRIEPLQD